MELILKDRLIDHGVSIYVSKTSETISIWKAFEQLEKLNTIIPERPIIELLVDDRNTIQHRFGHPNAETAYYYLILCYRFLQTVSHRGIWYRAC